MGCVARGMHRSRLDQSPQRRDGPHLRIAFQSSRGSASRNGPGRSSSSRLAGCISSAHFWHTKTYTFFVQNPRKVHHSPPPCAGPLCFTFLVLPTTVTARRTARNAACVSSHRHAMCKGRISEAIILRNKAQGAGAHARRRAGGRGRRTMLPTRQAHEHNQSSSWGHRRRCP